MDNKKIDEFLEDNLLLIESPQRYIGGETGSVSREQIKQADYRFGFCFPEVYELAESHLGGDIIYHLVNNIEKVACERIYAPWTDMAELLRDEGVPLFSLETHSPAKDFDMLGFSLEYELTYTNILEMLDLANIPIEAENRTDEHPLVIAGGPCAFNPEPLAPLFDLFYIGDAEPNLPQVLSVAKENPNSSRQELLQKLATIEGIYVPQFYEPDFLEQVPQYKGLTTSSEADKKEIKAQYVDKLEGEFYPQQPIIPWTEVPHDRLGVEIMRGCPEGCRFCMPGMIYRPVRERNAEEAADYLEESIKNTGWDEASLLSLSTTDYTALNELINKIGSFMDDNNLSISLPSIGGEEMDQELLDFLQKGRKSGLTFAPEAGTERLRKVINKPLNTVKLLDTIEEAMGRAWNQVKLYFMLGLPTETSDDIEGICDLIDKIWDLVKKFNGEINISLSPFSPKPHTPFQWERQPLPDEIGEKYKHILLKRFPRSIDFDRRDTDVSLLEGIIARGDRRIFEVIKKAWELGATFDSWTEEFDFSLWEQAFESLDIDYHFYTQERDSSEKLPWFHIDTGIKEQFLRSERKRAYQEELTPSCFDIGCQNCENCSFDKMELSAKKGSGEKTSGKWGRTPKRASFSNSQIKYLRIKYSKLERSRFVSQLDLQRLITYALRKSQLPVKYTEGYNKRPVISFNSPLPLGYSSTSEYMVIELERKYLRHQVNKFENYLPAGIKFFKVHPLEKGITPISKLNCSKYKVDVPVTFLENPDEKIKDILEKDEFVTNFKGKKKDIRKLIIDIQVFQEDQSTNTLEFLLMNGNQGTIRPDNILKLWGVNEKELAMIDIQRAEQFIYKEKQLRTLDEEVSS